MGLDMYLTKKIYIGAEYQHRKVVADVNISIDGKPVIINSKKIFYIEEKAGYWRKANHIHAWFVKNVQKGEDDCGEYEVTMEDFTKLLAACNGVLDNKDEAANLLPTKSGFFFGATEYDEYYFKDVEDTKAICEECLADVSDSGTYLKNDYHYHSSW